MFDRFNLDYFATVDRVVQLCEDLDIGIEMIMEGWGFEFPFNHRALFTAEWEELWMRYLIARYDAYNCLYVWTPLNEYEYYPAGDLASISPRPTAGRIRIARWIKATAPHGHVVAMHNGPRMPPFAERFRADPEAVDAIILSGLGDTRRGAGLACRRHRGADSGCLGGLAAAPPCSPNGATSATRPSSSSCPATSSATAATPAAAAGAARSAAWASSPASRIPGGRGWSWTRTSPASPISSTSSTS